MNSQDSFSDGHLFWRAPLVNGRTIVGSRVARSSSFTTSSDLLLLQGGWQALLELVCFVLVCHCEGVE
eukprot:2476340-Amphidinium_carterae.1